MARPACRSAGFVCPPNLLGYLCSSPCPTACADHRRLRQVKYLLSSSSSSSAEKKGKTVALISAACMPACMAVYLSARLITWPLAWPSAFPYLHIPAPLSHSPPLLTHTSHFRPPVCMFSHTYLLLLLRSSSCHTNLPICPPPSSPLPSRPYQNFTTLNYTSSPTTHLCPPPLQQVKTPHLGGRVPCVTWILPSPL